MNPPGRHPPATHVTPPANGPSPRRIVPPWLFTLALTLAMFLIPLGAGAQDCITELAVIHGGSSTIPAPAGFTKIPLDLNKDAGGDFVYLCYRRGIGAPITGLAVTVNNAAPPSSAYTRLGVDLNVGCGGDTDYLWLWFTRDPACTTIRDLHVQDNRGDPPTGFTRIDVDLNQGAHGAFIYLSYRKQ